MDTQSSGQDNSITNLYSPIEPFASGLLDVGDGQRLYWEQCGNPNGSPALVLHGGPGSGCTPDHRRFFDPDRYRIILFDQRGAGHSTPHAADPSTDLAFNTTHHLIADIERLRVHLGGERWLLFGLSWGSTLAVAYAERHPERVSAVILAAVALTSRREIDWITRDVGRYFPADWERFRDGVPAADRDGDLADAYARLLADPDPTVRERAAADWCNWEDAHVRIHPGQLPNPRYDDPRFRMGFARLVTHYWRHRAWLEDGKLIANAGRLAGIPGTLIHGQLDISSPIETAYQLNQVWPGSELVVVHTAGHSAHDEGMTEAIVRATKSFSSR